MLFAVAAVAAVAAVTAVALALESLDVAGGRAGRVAVAAAAVAVAVDVDVVDVDVDVDVDVVVVVVVAAAVAAVAVSGRDETGAVDFAFQSSGENFLTHGSWKYEIYESLIQGSGRQNGRDLNQTEWQWKRQR